MSLRIKGLSVLSRTPSAASSSDSDSSANAKQNNTASSLKVALLNARVIRAVEKGNADKASRLIREAASADWHPLGQQLVALSGEMREGLGAVEPDKPDTLEGFARTHRSRLAEVGRTWGALWKAEELDMYGMVRDATLNVAGTWGALVDVYYMVFCREDSLLLDKYQQMANLQMAHLNINSQYWGHDYAAAVAAFRGMKLDELKSNHIALLMASLSHVSQCITQDNAPLGGDEFVLLFQWVIMRSKLAHSWSILALLRDWVVDNMGLAAYTIATFEVALTALRVFSTDEATRNAEECLETNVNLDHFPQMKARGE